MPGNISPEERLLHLIKGKQLPNEEPAGLPPEASLATAGAKDEEQKPVPVIKKGIKIKSPFSMVNFAFGFILVVLLIAVVLGYIYPYRSQADIPDKVSFDGAKERQIDEVVAERPPLSYYTNTIGKRQMFRIFEPPKPKVQEPEKPKVTLQQLLAGYTFVGILFGDNPQAIVEDKRSGQSFYVNAGQMVGEIKIEKIERGKVTVSYGDEVMDINI